MLRKAVPDLHDPVQIYDLLLEMHKRAGMKLPAISPPKVLSTVGRCFEGGTILVWDEAGRIRGALGLIEDAPWWSEERHIVDSFWYVGEDVRHKKVAEQMLAEAKAYATMKGMPFYVGLFTGVDLFRKERYLARKGFSKVGSTMRWGV